MTLDIKEKEILTFTIKQYIDSGEPVASSYLSSHGILIEIIKVGVLQCLPGSNSLLWIESNQLHH